MAKNWIAGAIKHKGALRKSLGIRGNRKIPEKTLESAAAKGGLLAKRARLAMTLSKLRK